MCLVFTLPDVPPSHPYLLTHPIEVPTVWFPWWQATYVSLSNPEGITRKNSRKPWQTKGSERSHSQYMIWRVQTTDSLLFCCKRPVVFPPRQSILVCCTWAWHTGRECSSRPTCGVEVWTFSRCRLWSAMTFPTIESSTFTGERCTAAPVLVLRDRHWNDRSRPSTSTFDLDLRSRFRFRFRFTQSSIVIRPGRERQLSKRPLDLTFCFSHGHPLIHLPPVTTYHTHGTPFGPFDRR